MRDTFDTSPAPKFPAGAGREHYLPELYYFSDVRSVDREQALRITVSCLAAWCDNFVATWAGRQPPRGKRHGALPADLAARQTFLTQLLDSGSSKELSPPRLDLKRGDEWILYSDAPLFFTLILSPSEFAELQNCWEAHGLPRDLFYPASEQHELIEPVEFAGGVIRWLQRYTPRRWEERMRITGPEPVIPSTEKRNQAFLEASSRFSQAALLREMELREAGHPRDLEQLTALSQLHQHLISFLRRYVPEFGQMPDKRADPESERESDQLK